MILDTDVLIEIYRKVPAALTWLHSLPEVPKVAGLAAMELTEGALDARDLRHIQRFLTVFPLCWPTEADMMKALNAYQPLRLAHGIGRIDCLIAAIATGAGEELATFNLRHFRVVPGLVIVQPY